MLQVPREPMLRNDPVPTSWWLCKQFLTGQVSPILFFSLLMIIKLFLFVFPCCSVSRGSRDRNKIGREED